MSQLHSLTQALKTADNILTSETGDLLALAKIAGVAPDILFWKADLTGVDLRNQDISFLLPLGVNYHGAILTDKQTQAFRSAGRAVRRKGKEEDERIQIVETFIQSYEELRPLTSTEPQSGYLTGDRLRAILLEPLLDYQLRDQGIGPEYMNNTLEKLGDWLHSDYILFFEDVFEMLAKVGSPIDQKTRDILAERWLTVLQNDLGILIAIFRRTSILDHFWIDRPLFDDTLIAARHINSKRDIHTRAVEKLISTKDWSPDDVLKFFSNIGFKCTTDEAERLAFHLVQMDWPARETQAVLEAKTPTNVRFATFRQILAQGNDQRVSELIKWLDKNQGAVGALSLDNALAQITSFSTVIKLANDLAPFLSGYRVSVLEERLADLAQSEPEYQALHAFRRRHLSQ